MPIEEILVLETDFKPLYSYLIQPGMEHTVPNYDTEHPELVAAHCYPDGRGGEVYIFREFQPDWIEHGIPRSEFTEDKIEACVWPGDHFQRPIITIKKIAALLIFDLVSESESPEKNDGANT